MNMSLVLSCVGYVLVGNGDSGLAELVARPRWVRRDFYFRDAP